MPTPGKNESQKDFVSRCIKVVMDDGSAKDNKQAAAMCYSMWREHEKGKSIALSVVLKTDVSAGRVRWKAIANSGEFDQQGDRFDETFFDDIVGNFWRVQDSVSRGQASPPGYAHPEGMPVPQLDVAHYSFQLPKAERVKARAGVPTYAYRDSRKCILQGHFETTPLGQAASKSVLEDETDIIKTSVGVWPDWNRVEILDDGRRVFKGGADVAYLDHLALTAYPVDAQTEITAEGRLDTIVAKSLTIRDDALTVIKDEKLVQELEAASAAKSEVGSVPDQALVKASKTVGGKNYPASDFLVVEDADKPSTWHLQVKENGKANHTLMGGAYAALLSPGGHRGNKYEGPGKSEAVKKLKALYASEKMDWPGDAKKSDTANGTSSPIDGGIAESVVTASGEIVASSVPVARVGEALADSVVTTTIETVETRKETMTTEKDKAADAIEAERARLDAERPLPQPNPIVMPPAPEGPTVAIYESLAKSILETRSEVADVIRTLVTRLEVLEKSVPNLAAINELATALSQTIEATKAAEARKVKAMLDDRGWLDIGKLYSARSDPNNTVDSGSRAKGPQETEPQVAVGGPIAGKFIKT